MLAAAPTELGIRTTSGTRSSLVRQFRTEIRAYGRKEKKKHCTKTWEATRHDIEWGVHSTQSIACQAESNRCETNSRRAQSTGDRTLAILPASMCSQVGRVTPSLSCFGNGSCCCACTIAQRCYCFNNCTSPTTITHHNKSRTFVKNSTTTASSCGVV